MNAFNLKSLFASFFLIIILTTDSYSQEIGITLNFNEVALSNILDKIEEETGYFFLFNEKLIDTKQTISINITDKGISEVLEILFRKTNIKYSIVDNKIILAPEYMVFKDNQIHVSGNITDENGNPLAGVNIKIEGTTIGTISDQKGKYSINISNANAVLIYSFIGYYQQKIEAGGKASINISMLPAVSNLEEVIVVGYGTAKKSDLTGSIVAVNEQEYEAQPVTRIDDILQGRSAGVNVINVSGAPGGAATIRIRGSNSITGSNEPLYVIDGFVGVDMNDINPTDIESIQILKDASSTAIYGSRGANGVVLINTKKGRVAKPSFSITSRYFLSMPVKKWPLLNAGEFAQVCNERADALDYPRTFTDKQVSDYISNGGTDWQDLIYRTAGGEEVQLDYSGGSDAVTYFISGNYLNQDGIIINSDFRRYSLRTNIETKFSDKLRSSMKVNLVRRESNNTMGNFSTSSVVAGATAWAPTTPAYDVNGKLTTFDPVSSVKTNPIELATNDAINESNTASAILNFDYRIIRGLTLDVGIGINYNNSQSKSFVQRLLTKSPSASRGSSESLFLQNTNMLTYTSSFSDIHNIVITFVSEVQLQRNESFTAVASDLLFPSLKYNNITLAKTYSHTNEYTRSTIGSQIGRINYNLMNRYLLTASVRSDRSSKFRRSNQTSLFPSVGLGWRINKEDFLSKVPLISNLKLRASWGQTGSQAIGVYGTVTSYNTSAALAGTSWLNGTMTYGINIGDPGNEDLRWETTTQSDIGVDLGILKDRITLETDYFFKNTTDLLLDEPLPGYVGGGAIYENAGAVNNSGFEIDLNAKVIDKSYLFWNINFNISILNNKVTDLGKSPYIVMAGGAGAGMVTYPEMILKPGYNISSYYGFKSLGIWQVEDAALAAQYGQRPGDYRYEDVNGDFAFTGSDLQIIGSGIPKKVIGFNNTLRYKCFTLNAFFQSMLDYQKWDFAYAQIMIAAADAREFTHRDILNRWSPDNPTSRVAAFSKTNVPRIQSSEYVESGNYLRLKNISLQYTLPRRLLKWGDLSALISAQNLITLTKYRGLDPETYSNVGSGDLRGGDGGAYPNAKTWSIGLTLSF
jgi:TonB-dependent starch-binding outer membrane protein SusC